MTNSNDTATSSKKWPDDLLNRYEYSVFLTSYLEGKCGLQKPAIVAALDAQWGLGKTFFVEHWAADLRDNGRPVLFFNAWENDSADNPALSLMAGLHSELTPLYDALPTSSSARIELIEKGKQVFKAFRRATIPTVAVLAKGMLKKATGVAIEELSDAIDTSTAEPPPTASTTAPAKTAGPSIEKESLEAIEKGLDTFFEKSIEAHKQRLQSVQNFRVQLEGLLEKLHEHGAKNGPFWIFIDELDRCRPDYAITLLEGIKHLFNARGVIFVISTNLEQLSKAVGAVYGTNFDGHQYLKRFFNLEYTLPEPTRLNFIEALTKGTVMETIGGCSGCDPKWSIEKRSPAIAMSLVAEAMQLDLRSIQSIFTVVEAVALGMPKGTEIATIWLFYLAAVRHKNPSLLKRLTASRITDTALDDVKELLIVPSSVPTRHYRHEEKREVQLHVVLAFFLNASKLSVRELLDRYNRQTNPQYPETMLEQLIQFPDLQPDGFHPIHAYPKLINVAGHVST